MRVAVDGQSVLIPHPTAAALVTTQAKSLGFPPPVPYHLHLESRGNIAQANFTLCATWMDRGRELRNCQRIGSILHQGGHTWRIPQPMFDVLETVVVLSAPANDVDRFAHLARLKELLPDLADPSINTDRYFQSLRLAHAAAFSLRLRGSGDDVQFEPILFSNRIRATAKEENSPIVEAEALLAEEDQRVFARDRFPQYDECKDRYGLTNEAYLYIDPDCRQALTVVRRIQEAEADTRRQFARNPRVYLKEALEEALSEETLESLFIETEEFSARVIGIGLWTPPELPFLEPIPETWLPERFLVALDGLNVPLGRDELPVLLRQMTQAQEEGRPSIDWQGHRIAVTPDNSKRSGNPVTGQVSLWVPG